MTDDNLSLIVCQFCPLCECDYDSFNIIRARQDVKKGRPVNLPECPLIPIFIFGFAYQAVDWLRKFDRDDKRVPRWLGRWASQIKERYEVIQK